MKNLVVFFTIALFISCGQKTAKESVSETQITSKAIPTALPDENQNFDKIPNQAEDEIKKFPEYKDIIKSMHFTDNGSISKNIVNFFAADSLMITADVYAINKKSPYILLCHQAGYSRGEYINTVKELLNMGYNCVAIDQRSGDKINGIINETAKLAKEKGLPTAYLDARPDIAAAIDFTYVLNDNAPITLVGSSYSATLALLFTKNNEKVKRAAVFSPGEYFRGVSIMEKLAGFDKPVYVTGAKSEVKEIKEMTKLISSSYLTIYEPKEKGIHGSRALWFSTPGYVGYWKSFKSFLENK